MLTLGGLTLHTRALLAPLEGVSDAGFRAVCHTQGAALTFTEMVRASALGRGNAAAAALIDTHDTNTPTGVQLLASTPDELKRALDVLSKGIESGTHSHWKNISAIDLNFGCPSPSVIRDGAGPALLHRRQRLASIFSALADYRDKHGGSLNIKAIGCKLRLGLNYREATQGVYLDAACIAADNGIDWITLHARHAGQKSSDAPNWRAFTALSNALDKNRHGRPKLIANGDVTNFVDAEGLISSGIVDGVMIARGAIKSPWIFRSFTTPQATAMGLQRREGIHIPHGPSKHTVTSDADTSYIPTPTDVTNASLEWARLSALTPGGNRSKYIDFHTKSWARLLHNANTTMSHNQSARGNLLATPLLLMPLFPKNEHMS